MKRIITACLKTVVCAMLLTVCVDSFAISARQLKARIKARMPKVTTLLMKGVAGENNKGYLTLLKKDKAAQKIVDAENKDRKLVYTAIARQQQTTVELVAKRRAMMIAKRAPKGYMLQNDKGKWYKK